MSNYPPYSFWRDEHNAQVEAMLQDSDSSAGDVPLGLYLHIPFCRKRCKFCYFRVYTDRNSSEIQLYLDALAREVENFAGLPRIAGRSLQFVYFGGGTPSYISVKHLNALVDRLKAVLPWDDAEEGRVRVRAGHAFAAEGRSHSRDRRDPPEPGAGESE